MEKELSNSMGFIGKMNRWIQFTKTDHPCEVKRAGDWFTKAEKKWQKCDHIQGVLAGIKNMILL